MKVKDGIKIVGRLRITVRDAKTNEVLKVIEKENVITTQGLQLILDKLAEDTTGGPGSQTGITHLWVGDGTTAASQADTDLTNFLSEAEVGDYYRSGLTATFSTFFSTSEANHTWAEVGLANGPHGSGILITRSVFGANSFTKSDTQTVTVDYDITISGGG